MQIQAHLRLGGRGDVALETEVLTEMVIDVTTGTRGRGRMTSGLIGTQGCKAVSSPVLCPQKNLR